MTRFAIVALIAISLAGCSSSSRQDDFWRDYGNTHGADANGAGSSK